MEYHGFYFIAAVLNRWVCWSVPCHLNCPPEMRTFWRGFLNRCVSERAGEKTGLEKQNNYNSLIYASAYLNTITEERTKERRVWP